MYEVFDHTADLGLRIRAATLDELFAEAGAGLFSLIVADLTEIRGTTKRRMEIAGADREFLLFDWLNELLHLFESERLLLCQFVVRTTAAGLSAECSGEVLHPERHRLEHEVKAITYHGLSIRAEHSGWLAEIIVDI